MASFGKRFITKLKRYRSRIFILLFFILTSNPSFCQEVEKQYLRFFKKFTNDNRSVVRKWLDEQLPSDYPIGRSFALLAGVSLYPKMGFTECNGQGGELRPAALDIKKLRLYLENYEAFDEIVVLENEAVTTDNFEYFLQTYFAERIRNYPKSRFLFAYSGHGLTYKNDGYLLKSSATSCSDKSHSISLDVLRRFIGEVTQVCHHSLILINSCYGGKFLSFGESSKTLIPIHPGAHAITAGSDGELTFAKSPNEGSIFFEKIFTALDGRANFVKGSLIITTDELYSYLLNQVRGETDQKQNPKKGDIYPDGSRGEFFFINRAKLGNKIPEWKESNWKSWLPFGEDERPLVKKYPIAKEESSNNSIDQDLLSENRKPTTEKSVSDVNEKKKIQSEWSDDERILMVVEQQPEYAGGYEAMMNFVKKNMRYPANAKRMGIDGTVYVSFVIAKDGSINDVKVLRGISVDCDAEAVRLVESMPRWKPGLNNGKVVNVRFTLPIKFKLP